MEEQGLAVQQQAQQEMANRSNDMVGEVVQLLQQGISPEELIQMGIPQEVIEAAMSTMRSRMQMPKQEQGLAQAMG